MKFRGACLDTLLTANAFITEDSNMQEPQF